jgi:hypothetical protein
MTKLLANAAGIGSRQSLILWLWAALLPAFPDGVGAAAYPGYTFYASGTKAYLVDMNGKSLHTWTASGSAQTCAYLLADGSALFPIQNSSCTSPQHNGAYPSGRFQKISWDGTILWDYYFCDSTARAGYDVEPMPIGNILIPGDSSTVAKIFEIKPTGTTTGQLVWSNTLPSSMTSGQTYINSVSYNPELDKILVDLQDPQRKLVVIDHRGSGAVTLVYTVGSSGRVHAAAWVTKYFLGTTNVLPDADFAAMRTNNLLVVFNGGPSAVEVNQATNLVKTFSYAYSDHEGSVQRLPNGNTLLSNGNSTSIVEMNDSGGTVATITALGSIDRAYCHGYAFPGVSRLVTNMLTVVSPHGAPSPSGTTSNAYGAVVTAQASGYETNAGIALFANTGWALTGGKSTNGATSGTTTNVTLAMTNNVTLTWQWRTNYWLATATNGGGTLSFSNGVPGWNPSTNSVTIAATANPNWQFTAWSGDTSGCVIGSGQLTAPMTQARAITATFASNDGVTLTILSAHDSPNPGGTTTNASGTMITARVDQYETHEGSVQYENRGWTLMGGTATNGATSGTTTNVTLTLTNNTTLTWLWQSNYWLAAATNGGGVLGFSGGAPSWNPSTNIVAISATASPNWHFLSWSGDPGGCAIAEAQLTAPMTQARAIVGSFAITPGTVQLTIDCRGTNAGMLWLGATNLPLGATGSLLSASSLVSGDWQTGTPFIITTTETNWPIPTTGSNAFYRLRLQ